MLKNLEIISRGRFGVHCYGSVPNFSFESHVRYFRDCEEICEICECLFANPRVDILLGDEKDKACFWLFRCLRR